MDGLSHLRISDTEEIERYTYTGTVIDNPNLPSRVDKKAHATKLRTQLETAAKNADAQRTANHQKYPDLTTWEADGVVLTFESDPKFDLTTKSLELRSAGITLVSLKVVGNTQVAKVFVPEDRLNEFLKRIHKYSKSVILKFETIAANEEQLKELADPDEDIRVFGKIVRKDGRVVVPFEVEESQEALFIRTVGKLARLVETHRHNEKLIESISNIRLALVRDFWQDTLPYPEETKKFWWEIWLRGNRQQGELTHARFMGIAQAVGITQISERFVAFPERVVVHAYTSARRLAASIDLVAMLCELRRAKELATHYVELEASEQQEFADDVLQRMTKPKGDAPCVTILDGGVNRHHPLLEVGLTAKDMFTADPAWGVADSLPNQHGTGMAGNALYGCLTELLSGTGKYILQHRLESAKILPPPPAENDPPDFGRIMQDGAALAHIAAPNRNRVYCMAVTADHRDHGYPSLWSSAVDDLCSGTVTGKQQLMFVSAGNIRDEFDTADYEYHKYNIAKGNIDDPGQAWNAITVGAITEKCDLQKKMPGWAVMAESGDLSPRSRTSLPWPEKTRSGWPTKPDIVMEGGNYIEHATRGRSDDEDLSLLTTKLINGRLFEITHDTSPATALAARYAAIVWNKYPKLRPETVRALLIHSAEWNERMHARFPGKSKAAAQKRLRCYGYGVPNLTRALDSAQNAVTLVYEGELQPYEKRNSNIATNEMHVHQLPWPIKDLQELGEMDVRMRVTLSYFVEPNPRSVSPRASERYTSHGLRFDVNSPTESLRELKERLSRNSWEDPDIRPEHQAETNTAWVIGEQGRTHGSIHSDWWTGTGVQLAQCGHIVVHPVSGWWRYRPHLERYDSKARYTLIVSLETDETDVTLYTSISNATDVVTEIMA